MNKSAFFSIPESISFVEQLKSKIERMPDLLGFKSGDIGRNYKSLIAITNSLSIVFLQYDLHDLALVLLKYSSDADLKLNRYGSYQDKLWEGSLMTYNNLILLFHKVKHFKESLKLIYQAQNYIMNMKKAKMKLSPEYELCTHILSFVSLWRVGRSADCVTYLQSATDILNDFITQKCPTKLSDQSVDNTYGLIAASLSAVKLTVEKNKPESLQILQKALSELNINSSSRLILENLKILFQQNPSLVSPKESQEDWLCGDLYNQLLIASCFIPLIDPRTPIIHSKELEAVKNQTSGVEGSEVRKAKVKPIERKIEKPLGVVKPWWIQKEREGKGRVRARVEPKIKKKGWDRKSQSFEVASGIMFSPSSYIAKSSMRIRDEVAKSVNRLEFEYSNDYQGNICD